MSSDVNEDKMKLIDSVKRQVDDVKINMTSNIEKALGNTDALDKLVDETEELTVDANKFLKGSHQLRRALWLRNMKFVLMLVICTAVFIGIIVSAVCGSGHC